MILMLVEISLQKIYNIFTAAYVDHLTAAGPVDQLQKWWGEIWRLVPRFGYYPEGSNIFKKSIESEKKRKPIILYRWSTWCKTPYTS